jgi:hypothetical protein
MAATIIITPSVGAKQRVAYLPPQLSAKARQARSKI